MTQQVSGVEGSLASGQIEATPAAPAARQGTGTVGFLAGGGVAIAAVTSAIAFMSSTLARINSIYLLYSIVVLILLILLPTAIIGWLRLRARDIGLFLEAGHWAINAPMRLTARLGRQLTRLAR
jgi:hypothetical protein